MIPIERILGALAGCLEQDIPEPDGNGDRIFDLSGGMVLGIRELHGGEGVVAWSRVAYPPTGDPEAVENQAREYLRLLLARSSREEGVGVGTRDENGALVLYSRIIPDTEDECLEAVRRLLNEAEAQRRLMESGGGFGATRGGSIPGGMYGLG